MPSRARARSPAIPAGRPLAVRELDAAKPRSERPPFFQSSTAAGEFFDAPNFLVDVAVAIVRVIDVVGAAIEGDVVGGDQMNARDVTGPRLFREGAVEFVDQLPPLLVQRLRHSRHLILFRPNSL